jgi:RNA polymerase sigma factor (sigma-70 family)
VAIRGSPSLAVLSEAVLVQLAKSGDRLAYGELVRRNIANVHGFLRRLGAADTLADDITQETFLTAMSDIKGYRGEAPFDAWLRTIAARTLFRKRRKDARILFLADPVDADMPEDGGLDGVRHDLDVALGRLSKAERVCVTLSHAASFSHPEIAETLQMPVGTVKSHIARGLAKLRKLLLPYETGADP